MNTKIASIKKRFINACNKIVNHSKSASQIPPVQKLRLKSLTGSFTSNISDISSIKSQKASSGYGSSGSVNLDNYFDDEHCNIKTMSKQHANVLKNDIVKCLVEQQAEFIEVLREYLEEHVRPIGAFMEVSLYREVFQNIEKIYAMSLFINTSIKESLRLTNDIVASTLTVFNEYIQMIEVTYDTYLKGYANAEIRLQSDEFVNQLGCFESSQLCLLEFIDLPITNVTKLYCAFMSLNQITNLGEIEKINNICNQFKELIGPIDESLEALSIIESEISSIHTKSSAQSVLPEDYVDKDGKKYYFL